MRVNFGTQPFACADFNYLNHGFGRSLADPVRPFVLVVVLVYLPAWYLVIMPGMQCDDSSQQDIDDEALKAQELALLAEETAARARMASMVDEDAIEGSFQRANRADNGSLLRCRDFQCYAII